MIEEIRTAVHNASLENHKIAMFHYQVLTNAEMLREYNPIEFCHAIGVPESYQTEFRKMISLADMMHQMGTLIASWNDIQQRQGNMHNALPTEEQFTAVMTNIYHEARYKCHYSANNFLQMVQSFGGIETARRLINANNLSYGLEKLWECGHLEISMEALMLQDRWRPLFNENELAIARKRLKSLGYGID
jgi:hypothetical protein